MYGATPHIGHGLNEQSLKTALDWGAEVVVAQGTSTDPGPYYLGVGRSYMQSIQVKQDLTTLITNCRKFRVPFIISTGGAGDNQSLESVLQLVDDVANEEKIELNIAIIQGEISAEWLLRILKNGGKSFPLAKSRYLQSKLDEKLVKQAVRLVAQLGPEPIIKAIERPNLHGIITGRSLDVGLFVAVPIKKEFPLALSMHFATVMHDGALAAVPGSGSDGIFGILKTDHFILTPPNPIRRCTPTSVAAMSFYERSNPFEEIMPSGILDVSEADYEQIDNRSVRVKGAKWKPKPYTLKIEGAALQGYRSICMVGACDPHFLHALDDILKQAESEVNEMFSNQPKDSWEVQLRVYGRDAVLGRWAKPDSTPAEVGILIDVMATSQTLANAVCSVSRSALMHQGYPGRKTTAGNMAVPFSPVEVEVGPSYRYNIWHAIEVEDPLEPFPIKYDIFPRRI